MRTARVTLNARKIRRLHLLHGKGMSPDLISFVEGVPVDVIQDEIAKAAAAQHPVQALLGHQMLAKGYAHRLSAKPERG